MNGRVVVLGGWRAYALATAVVAVLLVLRFVASVVAVTALAVGAVMFLGYRALRALGLVRPTPRAAPHSGVIEAEYRVVERGLKDPTPEPRPAAERS